MGQSASTGAGAQNRVKFRSSQPVISPAMKKNSEDSDDVVGDVVVDVSDVGDFDYSSNIPDECLASIFHFLSSGDRKNCSLVCRRWLRVEGQSRHRLSLNAQSELVAVVPLIFSRFDSVTKLALKCDRRSTSIGDEGLMVISLRCRNLTRLKLRSCRELTDAGMEAFAKNCKGLKKLSCGSCAFGAKGMNAVLNNCSGLEELSVKRLRGITDGAAAEAIGPGVAGGSLRVICLKELYNGQCFGPLIIGSKNLRTLKLFRCSGDWDKILEVIAEKVSGLVEIHLERLQVLKFEIGTLSIGFRFVEDLVTKLSEVARVGDQLRFEACMDIMDLMYEKGEISSLNCSSHHLAASVVVAAYVVTVPLQKSEFPVLLWVKFVTSCREEDIVETVRSILMHVFEA